MAYHNVNTKAGNAYYQALSNGTNVTSNTAPNFTKFVAKLKVISDLSQVSEIELEKSVLFTLLCLDVLVYS